MFPMEPTAVDLDALKEDLMHRVKATFRFRHPVRKQDA